MIDQDVGFKQAESWVVGSEFWDAGFERAGFWDVGFERSRFWDEGIERVRFWDVGFERAGWHLEGLGARLGEDLLSVPTVRPRN